MARLMMRDCFSPLSYFVLLEARRSDESEFRSFRPSSQMQGLRVFPLMKRTFLDELLEHLHF